MIGECGVKPDEYWKLTDAETSAIITGHQRINCETAANFRNLYSLTYNLNAKKGKQKSSEQLWPLPTDEKNRKDMQKRIDLYKKILQN